MLKSFDQVLIACFKRPGHRRTIARGPCPMLLPAKLQTRLPGVEQIGRELANDKTTMENNSL